MTRQAKARVVIGNGQPIYRVGLRDFLEPEFDVVAEAATGSATVDQVVQHRPEVAILDVDLPGLDGIAAASQIREACPDTHVILTTAHDDERSVFEAIKAGVVGYVHRYDGPESLMQAVNNAAQGMAYLPPKVMRQVFDVLATMLKSGTSTPEETVTSLSQREVDVLRLIAGGKRNREIAEELTISERAVTAHITKIYKKLRIYDRSQALVYAMRKGIIRV